MKFNKNQAFPQGLHLVYLEGDTTPMDFLTALDYRNRDITVVKPGEMSEIKGLDCDCCPIELKGTFKEKDVLELLEQFKRHSSEAKSTILVFARGFAIGTLRKVEPIVYTYLCYNNTGFVTVLKSQGHPLGLFELDGTAVKTTAGCKEAKSETVTKVKDLVKTTHGFHQADITESHADAMLRGQKTDFICSAGRNVQKGDYLVLSVYNKQFHDISEIVWEVTFVSAIAHSERSDGYGAVVLSLRRLPNTRFKKGYLGGEYLDDCIVEEG